MQNVMRGADANSEKLAPNGTSTTAAITSARLHGDYAPPDTGWINYGAYRIQVTTATSLR
jgi:hypothetical protein